MAADEERHMRGDRRQSEGNKDRDLIRKEREDEIERSSGRKEVERAKEEGKRGSNFVWLW